MAQILERHDIPMEDRNPPRAPLAVPERAGPFKPQLALENIDPDQEPYPSGELGTFDVFALIVNKMIGTGIFSAPATVFLLTGRKDVTLGLFVVGWAYSLASMVMYLDYAQAWPYTGGELVYLNEMTAHAVDYTAHDPAHGPGVANGAQPPDRNAPTARKRPLKIRARIWLHKFLGDGLLAHICYSMSFIGVFNSGTNSMQVGRLILMCIAASESGTHDVHRDLARFIGVFVMSALCLLQYFSPQIGRRLNKFLATVKIGFLLVLIIVAAVVGSRDIPGCNRAAEWSAQYGSAAGACNITDASNSTDTSTTSITSKNTTLLWAKGLLAVLFSFEGWENATFVTGEIPRQGQKVLRTGFISAVLTVGALYLVVVATCLHCISWNDINENKANVYYPPMLTGNGTAAKRAWALVGVISALGSLNSIIYTFSRVKQVIGQSEILPWSKIWKKDDILQRDSDLDHPGTFGHEAPQGGLIIHWTMSVVVIASVSHIDSTLESISLPGYFQTYTHCFILMILGAVYYRLGDREAAVTRPPRRGHSFAGEREKAPPFRPSKAASKVAKSGLLLFVVLYVASNLALLIINALPPYVGTDDTNIAFPGFGFPIIVGGLLLLGTVYYVLIFGAARHVYPHHQVQAPAPGEVPRPPIEEEGLLRPGSRWNLLRLANVRATIRKDRYYNGRLERVYRFGRRWRIIYSLPGDDPDSAAQPAANGYANANGPQNDNARPKLTWALFWYWFFGGDRLRDTPRDKWRRWWNLPLQTKVHNLFRAD